MVGSSDSGSNHATAERYGKVVAEIPGPSTGPLCYREKECEMTNGTNRSGGCVRVGTWNVQWATPGSKKAPLLTEVLAAPDCDILAVTEGDAGILPKGGHVIDAGTDWGYPLPKASPGRRKVLLWSRQPWTPVFDALQDALPGGRLVAGVTETPVGKVTVVGVCIPWGGAHVTSGRRDRDAMAGSPRLAQWFRATVLRETATADDHPRRLQPAFPERRQTPQRVAEGLCALPDFDLGVHGRGVDSAWRERS